MQATIRIGGYSMHCKVHCDDDDVISIVIEAIELPWQVLMDINRQMAAAKERDEADAMETLAELDRRRM